ncbi:MAG: biotin carboxylase N-terminal domain-containing protein, partial [Myxococcales bacterium]
MAFRKVLIANRGAIAVRILRTLRRMGIAPVAVYSDADRYAPHVLQADTAVRLGPPPAADSYLRGDAIIAAARATGAEAIHPGYGFLSENAEFAARCEEEGLAFIGPTPRQMREFGLKHTARAMAEASGVPLLPGTGLLSNLDEAQREAARIGFPVMLKSTAGGGGIGMRRCASAAELADGYETVARLARTNFKDAGLYLEKLVERARHVEVQIFGDGAGEILALGERDCSVQRRNQKVLEETPAPGLGVGVRRELAAAAVSLGRAARYRSAGTVEFVMDAATGRFYFLEVNTRIQVEHGITEEVTGVDLVEWMVRLACGDLPPLATLLVENPHTGTFHARAIARPLPGAAVEARLYAEDPARGFQPSCGLITQVSFPEEVRVESWVETGTEVTPYYDPMIAKVIAGGATRDDAIANLRSALAATRVDGVETNRAFLLDVLDNPAFRAGEVHTGLLDHVTTTASAVEVVDPGTQTTVQDVPGRLGYWAVGVPPSGPMDALAFRLANRLVGNGPDAAGLECTVTGPALRFRAAATVAVTGADMNATLDGVTVPRYGAFVATAGAVLKLGAVRGPGCRAYVAIRGGFDVPTYLGSRATFTLGLFGGHGGRALRAGDVLHFGPVTDGEQVQAQADHDTAPPPLATLPVAAQPPLTTAWSLSVLHGPQSAPDFFTPG